ncbi:sigma-70 family RNA polymerase sigma factor [Bacteroides sedimenti]|uniref:DNA-directed RNA polymerase sigma-70 factor n=1 Tax=Bacteroides sedimenti TaxID=2136147 RepID=A0ABM8IJL1_9BACE
MDETFLVRQLKEGNQLAFNNLYKIYSAKAFALSFKYLCNKELAEDAVQNLFMKIWIKREDLDEDKPINRFIFTVLKNDLLNILRDTKNDIFVLDDCLEFLNYLDEETSYQELEQEQFEMIHKAIEQLSPQRKKIFAMKISGKYSNQEIADLLHLSVNTIKFQYCQSIKQIKTLIREYAIMLLM